MAVHAKPPAAPDDQTMLYAVLDDDGKLLPGAKVPAIPVEDLKRLRTGACSWSGSWTIA